MLGSNDVRHLEDTNTRNEDEKNKNAIDYLEASWVRLLTNKDEIINKQR